MTVAGYGYYASGYRGHLVVILPHRNLVIVHRVDTFRSGDEVTNGEFGVLLWRILDAAGETDVGEPPFIDMAPGVRLTGGDLRSLIPGSTLTAVGGGSEAVVVSDPEGGLLIYMQGALALTGSWWIDGDRYCVDVPAAEDIGGCFDVVLDGLDLRLYEPDGTLSIRFTIGADAPPTDRSVRR